MITETIARLRAQIATLGAALVDGAAAFGAATETNPVSTPAIYVVPLSETPAPTQFDGVQRVTGDMAIVCAVRNLTDARGEAAQIDLQALRVNVKAALLGWVPADGHTAIERGAGRLLAFRDGHLWWQDIYRSNYFEKTP